MPQSTVDRIEAGRVDARVGTLAALFGAMGLELGVHLGGTLLTVDAERERLVDFAGRHLPPHWEVEPVVWLDEWWGWWRKKPRVRSLPPTHRYWRRWGRHGHPDADGLRYLWQDAT